MTITHYLKKTGFLAAILSPVLSLAASLPEWQIVPTESTLTFTATQNGAPISGEFKQFSGEVFVDPANYQTSKIHITVLMNSLSASYADLVTTLTTPDWFNVKLFPTADFKASDFKQTGEKTYAANGMLTIRDKTAPITLNFTAKETSKNKALVQGSTVLKRTAFGVGQGEWSSTDQVGDDVTVEFKLVATKKE